MFQKPTCIEEILSRFPKRRPTITREMAELHTEILRANRERETIISKFSYILESWMHKQVAARNGSFIEPVLEIGAGTLNHIPYEPNGFEYDAVEPMLILYRDKPQLQRIRNLYNDLDQIPLNSSYGRIISVATLEHLVELPKILACSGLLLREDGVFQAGIPCEGGALWGISWRVSTSLAYRLKTGLSFKKHMEYEHVNDANEIRSLLKFFFRSVTIRRFPLPFFHLSLYEYLECRSPKLDICREYLTSESSYYQRGHS